MLCVGFLLSTVAFSCLHIYCFVFVGRGQFAVPFSSISPTAHGQFFKSPSSQWFDLNFIIDISTDDIEECEFNIS